MRQVETDPGTWEVKPGGFTTSAYGIKTFESNDDPVRPGNRIYQGWYDRCRNVSHFYATAVLGSGSDSGSSGSDGSTSGSSGSSGSDSGSSGSGSSGSQSGSDTSGSQSGSGCDCPEGSEFIEVLVDVTVACVDGHIQVTKQFRTICVPKVCA